MLNRCLSLLVFAVALASAAVMLVAGARPLGVVTLADRLPCLGLAALALTLAILHLRAEPARTAPAEGAMWSGLAIFFVVAAFASPHLAAWSIVAALLLAATSVARLVAAGGRSHAMAQSPFRRRLFA